MNRDGSGNSDAQRARREPTLRWNEILCHHGVISSERQFRQIAEDIRQSMRDDSNTLISSAGEWLPPLDGFLNECRQERTRRYKWTERARLMATFRDAIVLLSGPAGYFSHISHLYYNRVHVNTAAVIAWSVQVQMVKERREDDPLRMSGVVSECVTSVYDPGSCRENHRYHTVDAARGLSVRPVGDRLTDTTGEFIELWQPDSLWWLARKAIRSTPPARYVDWDHGNLTTLTPGYSLQNELIEILAHAVELWGEVPCRYPDRYKFTPVPR